MNESIQTFQPNTTIKEQTQSGITVSTKEGDFAYFINVPYLNKKEDEAKVAVVIQLQEKLGLVAVKSGGTKVSNADILAGLL